MTSNYEGICEENRRRYGTEGAQKSGGLAAGLYDDRTHFIFELLQNAEDALKKRGNWLGPRKVTFSLTPTRLTISHFGKPFDEADVRSVCDIAESTKNESSIGRFGLGFKSVYTITDLPEIHSGVENFYIEDYVFPKQASQTPREPDETQITLPLRSEDKAAVLDITEGFRHLGRGALLFLRNIDEINWSVEEGASGFYVRNSLEPLGLNTHRITILGEEDGRPEIDQNWLVFHRDVFKDERQNAGRVEIAFALANKAKGKPGCWEVKSLSNSPMVVFFPTVVESHLGFLAQGPYRTTPSRDNIPSSDPWNQHLVKETASLLIEAMRWMRDNQMLDASTLLCLPLDPEKFPNGSRFAPMYESVRRAFQDEALLPALPGGYVTANQAKLARTQELRELLSSKQIEDLFDLKTAAWLSSDITQDKTPDLRHYLMRELGIEEITPAKLISGLTKSFLEAQTDEWVLRLYKFLSGQESALRRRLDSIPLIRLEDGTHVVAHENGEAKAFLPSTFATGFPTVRREVCATSESIAFLSSLKISEPDPVDDVIQNILPKYRQDEVDVGGDAYAADIERIRAAFSTDSTAQREKLRSALRDTTFVMVVNTGNGNKTIAKPCDVYIATDRLKQLFASVEDVLIVNDEYECLRGEVIRDLLIACGASRYLSLEPTLSWLSSTEKTQIRKDAGLERASWDDPPEDFTLRGLVQLLKLMPNLEAAEAKIRAGLLWDALGDLEGRGPVFFLGSYKWGYSRQTKVARFEASFVRMLNQVAWVPNAHGELVPPELVEFETLGWKPSSFLLTNIAFKPPILNQLAKEAGIDPAAIDLLRKLGITNVDDLTTRLGIANPPNKQESSTASEPEFEAPSDYNVYGDAKELYGDDMPDIPPGTSYKDASDSVRSSDGHRVQGRAGTGMSRSDKQSGASDHSHSGGNGAVQGVRALGYAGRPFISYVGVHPENENTDPDALNQAERMKIEESAINLILTYEPVLRRTPEGNPGFDLFEVDTNGEHVRWVEVKSMTGCLDDRPVGLSHTQFDYAREKGDSYWLYVVEYASDPVRTRLLRIQNPAGYARTFTFDRGWREVARTEITQ